MRNTKLLSVLLTSVVVIAACDKKKDGKEATCAEAVDHIAKVAEADGEKNVDKMRPAMLTACEGQEWSAEVRSCLVAASSKATVKACMAKVSAMKTFANKAKTSEAREMLRKLYDASRAYYMDPHVSASADTMAALTPQYPGEKVGPTPPLGECCKQGGKCAPSAELWTDDTWVSLQFSMDDPHYYSYSYEPKDIGNEKNKEFVLRAIGDLDCNGKYSTFEMIGAKDAPFKLNITDELE